MNAGVDDVVGIATENMVLPHDSLGFVRRECPGCHRLFKVKGTAMEGLVIYHRLAGHVAHGNAHEASWPMATRHCPYCGRAAADDAWFTAEQRSWLDKRAETFGLELRYEQLAHVERTLSLNPNPTFLPVRPEPPAPALRAEPDDMRVVPLICCREEAKISDSWPGPVHCFYCGVEHEVGAVIGRERLDALLGE